MSRQEDDLRLSILFTGRSHGIDSPLGMPGCPICVGAWAMVIDHTVSRRCDDCANTCLQPIPLAEVMSK